MAGISLPGFGTNRDFLPCTQLATLAVLCLAIVLIGMPCHVEGADSNNNNDGNLTFADLPEGESYQAAGETDYYEGQFPLPTTWKFIESFLKTISPAPPPYGKLQGSLQFLKFI